MYVHLAFKRGWGVDSRHPPSPSGALLTNRFKVEQRRSMRNFPSFSDYMLLPTNQRGSPLGAGKALPANYLRVLVGKR